MFTLKWSSWFLYRKLYCQQPCRFCIYQIWQHRVSGPGDHAGGKSTHPRLIYGWSLRQHNRMYAGRMLKIQLRDLNPPRSPWKPSRGHRLSPITQGHALEWTSELYTRMRELVSKAEFFREQRQQYLLLRMLQQKKLRTLRTNLFLLTDNRKMDLKIRNWRTHKAKMVWCSRGRIWVRRHFRQFRWTFPDNPGSIPPDYYSMSRIPLHRRVTIRCTMVLIPFTHLDSWCLHTWLLQTQVDQR